MSKNEKILEPVQSIVHESLYNITFMYVLYKIYQSNENKLVKYSHIIVLTLAIYTHVKRLINNKERILKFTKENKIQVMFEIIKYLVTFYTLYNLHDICNLKNLHIFLFMGAFIDFLLYYRTFEKGLFRNFITFEDKNIIFLITILIFLNKKFNIFDKHYHLIYYDLFYHIIELTINNLFI